MCQCGHPSSGKSRVAETLSELIRQHLQQRGVTISVHGLHTEADDTSQVNGNSADTSADDPAASKPISKAAPTPTPSSQPPSMSSSTVTSLHVINHATIGYWPAEMYSSIHAEQRGRSIIRSAVERSISRRSIVIVDYINAIKGFRYELYCRAREAATTHCVLYVDTDREICRQWNSTRSPPQRYNDSIIDDLLMRLEVPDNTKRWDAPLFTVKPAAAAATTLAPTTNTEPDDAVDEAAPVDTIRKPSKNDKAVSPTSGDMSETLNAVLQWVLYGVERRPGQATVSANTEPSSYLSDLDHITSALIQAVLDVQKAPAFTLHTNHTLPFTKDVLTLSAADSLGRTQARAATVHTSRQNTRTARARRYRSRIHNGDTNSARLHVTC